MHGLDTIDATNVDTSFAGHAYFAENESVIADSIAVMRDALPADQRPTLDEAFLGNLTYWRMTGER